MSEPFQLLGLILVGAVVLVGSRHELRQVRWGPWAWRVMLIAFLIVAGVAGALVLRRETEPPRTIVIPRGEGIAT